MKGRYWVYLFLFSLCTINYIDRVALSVGAKPIAAEFGISTVQLGYLFSSFIWTYLVCLIPMGMLADRFGSRVVAGGGMLIWSLATICTGFSWNFGSVLATRLVMGAGEATTYPAGGRLIREWAPRHERGLATSMLNSGAYAGPALGAILVAWLIGLLGWRGSFVVTGGIGFVWLAAWLIWYRTPDRARFLGDAERAEILRDRDAGDGAMTTSFGGMLGLLRCRSMWGLALSQGCAVYAQYLFLTWLPSYLETAKHLSVVRGGLFTALPYAIAVVLCMLLGRFSDRLLSGPGVHGGQRRTMVVIAMLSASVVLLTPLVDSLWLILLLVTISLTGLATAISLNIALTNDLLRSPQQAAKAVGIQVSGGNLFGIAAPIVTGYVIAGTGSYDAAFVIAGLLLVAGAVISLTMTRRPIETDSATLAQPVPTPA